MARGSPVSALRYSLSNINILGICDLFALLSGFFQILLWMINICCRAVSSARPLRVPSLFFFFFFFSCYGREKWVKIPKSGFWKISIFLPFYVHGRLRYPVRYAKRTRILLLRGILAWDENPSKSIQIYPIWYPAYNVSIHITKF